MKPIKSRKASKAPSQQVINSLMALHTKGRYPEATALAKTMTERYPMNKFGWITLGAVLMEMGRNTEALAVMQKAAGLLPGTAEVHCNLGTAFTIQNRLDEAEASYRRALEINPNFVNALSNLGYILVKLGRFEEAEAICQRALEINPSSNDSHVNLGVALYKQNRIDEAEASYLRALKIKPDVANTHSNLGNILAQQGRLEEAEASYQRALKIKPDFVEVRFSLAQIKKGAADDESMAALIAIEKAANDAIPLSNEKAMLLNFALGKCYDDICDYEKAFPHFLEGCKLKRVTFDYDPDQTTRYFASIMRVFNQTTMERLHGAGDSSYRPIFVLGMPRSGTTLIEQIISSHPEVHGAGELPDLMAIAQCEIMGATFPDNLLLADQTRLSVWGAEYVTRLQRHAPNARHITDKMPINFAAIGLIHLMLPNARIIHINRNPIDTCLSCLFTLFKHGHEYTYDLMELGRYYVDYAHLMEHWRKLLPSGAFLNVQYEDIVVNQEVQSRRIMEYCGLEWNDAYLDFHKNKRPIHTASMAQVRQPMYKTSVERWRSYEKFLGSLVDVLGELDLAPI
jgi:tetratricopeptide (TPR) repeat protein